MSLRKIAQWFAPALNGGEPLTLVSLYEPPPPPVTLYVRHAPDGTVWAGLTGGEWERLGKL